MKKQTRAFAFGIITVLLWSTVASAFKLSLRYLEPIQLLLYATATSVVTLFLILALQGKLSLIRSVTGTVVLRAGLLGIINPENTTQHNKQQ
jgi:hypothetical protein